jgi:SNF family Na+-dependent transporter
VKLGVCCNLIFINEYFANKRRILVKNEKRELFSSRLGLVLAGIGMAVGTGNIWRFPRIAGKNGGLAFIIAWLLALFVWSIPLMMAEMIIGRESRKGPVGALRSFAGEKFTFLGAWVSFVTLAIMFYYSVVAGWCLRYFTYFVVGMVPKNAQAASEWWKAFTATPWQTIFFHLTAISIAAYVVSRGIQAGLEKANKVLLPALFVMLVGLVIRALTLPGSWEGVRFLFQLDPTDFLKAKNLVGGFLSICLVHWCWLGPAAHLRRVFRCSRKQTSSRLHNHWLLKQRGFNTCRPRCHSHSLCPQQHRTSC